MSKWDSLKTKHGYPADEVISALQKDIRRGNEENAMIWAYELVESGAEFASKFWERMSTIATEDIGHADPQAAILIQSLRGSFANNFDRSNDQNLQALFAASYLARCDKDRYLDEALHFIKDKMENKKEFIAIPDYALDKHTKRGEELGRARKHFYEEAAFIAPTTKSRNKKYQDFLIDTYNLDKNKLS